MNRQTYPTENDIAKEIFRDNLAILLREKDLHNATSAELCRQFNTFFGGRLISTAQFYKLRSGQNLPSAKNFVRLADWLDCEWDDLLDTDGQMILRGAEKIFAH